MNETRLLAEYVCGLDFECLPADVVELARINILDQLGCAIRGATEPVVQILADEMLGIDVGPSSIITGALEGAAPVAIARVLATAGHAIDYDDTNPDRGAHISTPVLGALFALAPTLAVDGRAFITAYVAGYEAAVRVCRLLTMNHYQSGFHTTGTAAIFGAAAACAHLSGLGVAQMRSVIGLAATQASGIKCTFGTMAKPLNAGAAASNGLLAARLVGRGITAPQSALEQPKGFLALFGGVEASQRSVAGQNCWAIRDNMIKLHAACHATHPMIYALRSAVAEHELSRDSIESVAIEVAPLAMATASIIEPKSRLDMKFSFTYVAAAVLSGLDTSGEDAFDDAALNDMGLQRLLANTKVCANEALEPRNTLITVTLRDGGSLFIEAANTPMPTDFIESRSSVERKFLNNTVSAVGDANAKALMEKLGSFERLPRITFDLG